MDSKHPEPANHVQSRWIPFGLNAQAFPGTALGNPPHESLRIRRDVRGDIVVVADAEDPSAQAVEAKLHACL